MRLSYYKNLGKDAYHNKLKLYHVNKWIVLAYKYRQLILRYGGN